MLFQKISGKGEIGTSLSQQGSRRISSFLNLRRGDMGANGCPDGHQKGEKREAVLVVGVVEVAVGHQVGQFGESAMPQVHGQDGQIVEHVDRRDLLVELDAVEQARLAVEQAYVAEMQIAVAAPYLAGQFALVQRVGVARQCRPECCVDPSNAGRPFASRVIRLTPK